MRRLVRPEKVGLVVKMVRVVCCVGGGGTAQDRAVVKRSEIWCWRIEKMMNLRREI